MFRNVALTPSGPPGLRRRFSLQATPQGLSRKSHREKKMPIMLRHSYEV